MMASTTGSGTRGATDQLRFVLPAEREASEPPEARGLERDEVRLLVSYRASDRIAHARFRDLPMYLDPGDVLVINTSGTMNASLSAARHDGSRVEVHLSTRLPGGLWTVEIREPNGSEGGSNTGFEPGERLSLPAGSVVRLHVPYDCGCGRPSASGRVRLWLASLELSLPLAEYLERHGSPIRYGYVRESWPGSYYQTVFSTDRGSAEMPSAGRPFSGGLVTRLVALGIQFAPVLLHTGVASLESHEPPYEEAYKVPLVTADLVNAARKSSRRVIAVGTTAVRALETVTDERGEVHPGEGWTCLVVSPDRGIRAFDGLITGLHEPRSSHLMMLEAFAPVDHLRRVYDAALAEAYLWHEFGDIHLLLP